MAARTRRIALDANTRAKIQTTQLIKRLTKHALGELEMTSTQVAAALGLIKKTLPDLQAIELDLSPETAQRVINAQPMNNDEWQAKYSLAAPEGSTESIN